MTSACVIIICNISCSSYSPLPLWNIWQTLAAVHSNQTCKETNHGPYCKPLPPIVVLTLVFHAHEQTRRSTPTLAAMKRMPGSDLQGRPAKLIEQQPEPLHACHCPNPPDVTLCSQPGPLVHTGVCVTKSPLCSSFKGSLPNTILPYTCMYSGWYVLQGVRCEAANRRERLARLY